MPVPGDLTPRERRQEATCVELEHGGTLIIANREEVRPPPPDAVASSFETQLRTTAGPKTMNF